MSKTRVLDPGVLAGLKGLSVRVDAVVEGLLAGLHRSPYRGVSSEFAEHKEYSEGDELRSLDWKILGRSDRYYVKQYQEETNLSAYILLDLSKSMDFGTPLRKHDYAAVLAGSLSFILTGQVDMVGIAFARPSGLHLTPIRTGKAHLQNILSEIEKGEPQDGPGDLAAAIDELGDRIRRRSLVVVVSDLLTDGEQVLASLNRLRRRPADVVVVHTMSDEELRFPYSETARFIDPETGEEIPADPETVRERYEAQLNEFLVYWRENCLARGIRYLLADGAAPPAKVLRQLLGRERVR